MQMPVTMSGSQPEGEDDGIVCVHVDVSKAHFHATSERTVFATINGKGQRQQDYIQYKIRWN